MAPIPASAPLINSIRRGLADLSAHQIPLLRDCQGPLSAQQELARDVRGDIQRIERAIEELEEVADDQDTELERIEILEVATGLGGDLADLRGDYRNALLVSKRAIDANPSSKRDELLYSKNSQLKNNNQTDDPIQEKANQVTAALRQTTELMKEELDRSVMTGQMLDESTSTLRSTTTLYETYSSLLTTSNQLLTALENANYLDRILILGALLFFVAVCLWILKRRVLDKAVGAVGWAVGGGGGGQKKAAALAAAKSASSVAAAVTASLSAAAAAAASSAGKVIEEKDRVEAGLGGFADEVLPSAPGPTPEAVPLKGEWDEGMDVPAIKTVVVQQPAGGVRDEL